MRIEHIAVHPLAAPAERPVLFAIGPYQTFTATLVEVRTDDGRVGVGECIVRRAPRVTATIVQDLLAPALLGQDPRDVGRLWEEMFARLRRWGHSRGFVLEAMSGVDIALWDLVAQVHGEPLYRALRGAGRDRVPCYASKVYLAPTEEMVAQARQQVAAGYAAVKVQVGRGEAEGGFHGDLAAVRAIRQAVGPQVLLLLDANGAFDAATAIRFCRHLEELDIAWLEEPVPPDDISGYALLRRSTTIPVAGGEAESGVFGFRDLIAQRAIDILQPDVARIGGFTAALMLGALAYAYNLRVAPHTGYSAGVAHLAALHLAAATPNLLLYEYMLPDLLAAGGGTVQNPLREIFTTPFPVPRLGMLDLPSTPGLGLQVDWERVRRFALP